MNLLVFVRFDLAVLPVVLRGRDFVAVAFSAMVTMLLLLPGAVFGRLAPWLAEPGVDVLLKIVVSVIAGAWPCSSSPGCACCSYPSSWALS